MKILVFGASRGTGLLCVERALALGHSVVAVSRNADTIAVNHESLTKLNGDFNNKESVTQAVKQVVPDAVIISVGAKSLKIFKDNPNFFSAGTECVISALRTCAPNARLVILSAMGTKTSGTRQNYPWILRTFLLDWILAGPFDDHERQEEMVKASGLNWTIALPSGLTDYPASGKSLRETDPTKRVPLWIARDDVAQFLVEACTSLEWQGKSVTLGG